ncbi:MAG: hypothetical protein AABM30_11730 [Actinomycetota bacterium]
MHVKLCNGCFNRFPPEALERERAEKREALERFKRETGHYPA